MTSLVRVPATVLKCRAAFLGGALFAILLAAPTWAGEMGVPGAAPSASVAGPAEDTGGGRVFIDDIELPLGDVLDYLSRVGGYSIVPLDDSIRNIRVRARMDNVYWRGALDIIAMKYNLEVEERVRDRVLTIDRPKPISMTFEDGDVRKVVTAIAKQAGANVVMGETVRGKVTFHLNEIPWRDALEIIAKAAGCVVVPERRNVIRIALPEELEAQMETRIFQLAYIQAEGSRYRAKIKSEFAERVETGGGSRGGRTGQGQMSLQEVLASVKSTKGSVATLRGTNALVVQDTTQKLKEIERIINQLDKPPKQVHLSIKLIELSDSDADEIGVLWQNGIVAEASGMSFSTMFPFMPGGQDAIFGGTPPGDFGAFIDRDDSGRQLGSPNWISPEREGDVTLGTMDFRKLQLFLNFVQTQTAGRMIQAPQLIALDHEEATIHVGELVRYAESFVSTTEGGGTASGFKEAANSPVNLGIQVLVIPHVTGPDNNIILTVIPKTESPQTAQLFETFSGGALGELKLPQTTQRTVVTKMMLRDRETGIIAGLRQQRFGETVTKIPFLGDIPIVGWLFKHRSRPAETNKNSNLLILLTPTIIDFERKIDVGDMVKRAEDELGKEFSLEDAALPQILTPTDTGTAAPTFP
jgi:type IV pilus assembly protein PilQ